MSLILHVLTAVGTRQKHSSFARKAE